MDRDDFALLKVIDSTLKSMQEDVREIKDSLKNKVEYLDFKTVKDDVDDLKKSKWFTMGVSAAVGTAFSFISAHFIK